MSKVCIIVPCFNEADRIDVEAFVRYFSLHENHFLVLVDDGSSDLTKKRFETIKKGLSNQCSCVYLPKNRGKAEAVRQGFLANINKDYDYIAYWDADLATPLSEVSLLLAALKNTPDVQIAIGSRLKRRGANIKRRRIRHYTGRIFSAFVQIFFPITIYDTQCGAKIFSINYAQALFFEPFSSPWLFDLEILWRVQQRYGGDQLRHSILEVPLNEWVDRGVSKVKFTYFFRAPFEFLILVWKYRH